MPTRPIPENMVLIPAGRFRMGSDASYEEEGPAHEVEVDAFALDRYPVTNAQYRDFCDATGRAYPTEPRWERMPGSFLSHPTHPVVNVTHDDATAYAAWAGKRLPTESEWEYAARGGLQDAAYPWGDEEPEGTRAQYAARDSEMEWRDWRFATGYRYTAPVGSFPPNGYGLYDVAGNVWEWCADWFYRYPWEEVDLSLAREAWGLQRVVRGGAFYSPPWDLRVSRRLRVYAGVGGNGMGFRCAFDLEAPAVEPAVAKTPVLVAERPTRPDAVALRMERGVELCLGVGPKLSEEDARRIANMGFTSVEQYVTWETVENAAEGAFDFAAWDEQVALLKRHGLRWVPFLIAGPAYSLPDWYRRSGAFRGLVCLEHRLENKTQSIWDPAFLQHVDRFLGAFADRYRDADVIESLLLGITGDFGEAIFPVTGTTWTTIIPGPYHTHGGYWCGDRFAAADFRTKLLARFGGDVEAINKRWGTAFQSAAEVDFPPLAAGGVAGFRVDEPTSPGRFPIASTADRRRWLDFVGWYREAVNGLADAWMGMTRRHFPDHPIYLCTGGSAPPEHGAHFGEQCRVAAAHGGGVRITNEASNYAHNFVVTHWVSSAGRFYGAYFGFEPAGGVDERGVTARIYNAAASGARNLHFYQPNIFELEATVDAWIANFDQVFVGEPDEDVALLYPDTSIVLGEIEVEEAGRRAARLRDLLNFDFVDDAMIAAGALSRYRVLIVVAGKSVLAETIEAVRRWLDEGGMLLNLSEEPLHTVDEEDVTGELFPPGGGERSIGSGKTWRLVGADWDARADETIAAPLRAWFAANGRPLLDGAFDLVYAARLVDRVMLLHHGEETIVKQLTMADGSRQGVSLPPNSIVSVPLA